MIKYEQKQQVLEACHNDPVSGAHFGRDKVVEKIEERYYWVGIIRDVLKVTKTCDKCQRANPKFHKTPARIHPIPVTDQVWHTVGIDLIGPLPKTERGNEYIATCTCLFSKWPEAEALQNKSATSVAEFVFRLICRHGCPTIRISDQGREFVNAIDTELCKLTGVDHRISSAYHPQTNGQDERFNQTLQRSLRKLVNEDQTDWDKYIDPVLFAYRTSRQDSSKYTPFYLMYGRQATLPIDILTDQQKATPTNSEVQMTDEQIHEKAKQLIELRKKALGNVNSAKEKMKRRADAKHNDFTSDFTVGSLVLVLNSKKLSRKGGKMEPLWHGPHRIHEDLGKGCFKLCLVDDCSKILAQKYNVQRLKLYHLQSG